MNLNEDQITELETLSGCNYTLKQVAMYFNLPYKEVMAAYQDEKSTLRYHYDRGKLIVQAQIDIQATSSAQNGNLTAMQRLDKISAQREFINSRDEMINTVISRPSPSQKQLYPADEDTGL